MPVIIGDQKITDVTDVNGRLGKQTEPFVTLLQRNGSRLIA
jgi:hypothetical protein